MSRGNRLNGIDDPDHAIGHPLDPATEFATTQAELNETMVHVRWRCKGPRATRRRPRVVGLQAWSCGFANRRPNGEIIETTRNFHLDHLNPLSKAGTSHQITNRAPLCPYHNIKKSNHRLHLAEYRETIADAGELMVDTVADLIDLDYAFDRALNIY